MPPKGLDVLWSDPGNNSSRWQRRRCVAQNLERLKFPVYAKSIEQCVCGLDSCGWAAGRPAGTTSRGNCANKRTAKAFLNLRIALDVTLKTRLFSHCLWPMLSFSSCRQPCSATVPDTPEAACRAQAPAGELHFGLCRLQHAVRQPACQQGRLQLCG